MKRLLCVAMLCVTCGSVARADVLSGSKTISLSNDQGERVAIGRVVFTPEADGRTRFSITLDDRLEEFFLAMRPFRCLTGAAQRLCNFPVVREAPLVSERDLVPLEYALMFMRTAPAALHINPFNGVYYRMKVVDGRIEGAVHDVDMEPFIVPDSVPLERRTRPLRDADLNPGDPRSHWMPRLTIE
ncbi:MAG TPA: hypothetical protein VIO81_03520 [Methyloversatilis sp.]